MPQVDKKRKRVPREKPEVLLSNDSDIAAQIVYGARGMDHGGGVENTLAYLPELKVWRMWADTHWITDPTGTVVRNDVIEHFLRYIKIDRTNDQQTKLRDRYLSATKIAHVEQRLKDKLPTAANLFDRNPDLMNFVNGTLDAKHGEFTEHQREDYITTCLPFGFDPEAPHGLWRKWLDRMLPDEAEQRAIQTIMGYAVFTDGNPERILVWLVGGTSCGKSTFIETIGNVIGPDFGSSFNMSIFKGSKGESARPDIKAAMRKRLIWASETSSGDVLFGDRIKMLVGGDKISARGLYEAETSELPSFTPVIATNDIPSVKNADSALRRRWVALKFNHRVPKRNEKVDLVQRMSTRCAPDIMNWLFEGYWRYMKEKLGPSIKTLQMYSDESFAETSDFTRFMNEATRELAGAKVTSSAAYDHFVTFCSTHGIQHVGSREFGKQMTSLGWKSARTGRDRLRVGRELI